MINEESVKSIFLHKPPIDNMNKISSSFKDYCKSENITENLSEFPFNSYLAYILATVHHETNQTFTPIKELGNGKNRPYGNVHENGNVYFGRGFVQLTWDYNYQKFGKLLNIDLYNKPDLALDEVVASKIMFLGMTKGLFTGRSLNSYFYIKNDSYSGSQSFEDSINARRIINGLDCALKISSYYKVFLKSIETYGV